MEKNTIIKYIANYLQDNNYLDVKSNLEKESLITLESIELKKIKNFIKKGNYDDAIAFISKNCNVKEKMQIVPKIRILQFIESLMKKFSEKNSKKSLEFLRRIYKSGKYYEKDVVLEKCACLIFIKNKEDLISKCRELAPYSFSKEVLIDYVSLILKEGKIDTNYKSLDQILNIHFKKQIDQCLFHNIFENNSSLFEDHKCSNKVIPFKCDLTIEKYNEEIMNIVISKTERYLAVIFKNNSIAVYKLESINNIIIVTYICLFFPHKNYITSCVFNSQDSMILTAGKDKSIKIWDLNGKQISVISNLDAIVSSAIFSDDQKFIICSLLDKRILLFNIDGIFIRYYESVIVNELLYSKCISSYLMVAPTLKSILVDNMNNNDEIQTLNINDTIISVSLNKPTDLLLVNSSNITPIITLWDLYNKNEVRKYFGHRQDGYNNKCSFGGYNERFIICGSSDKLIYIWNRNHSVPILTLKSHCNPVNSVIWPSSIICLFVSSDDNCIKFFTNNLIERLEYYDNRIIDEICESDDENKSSISKSDTSRY